MRNLTLGDRGREVSDVQKRLRAQGFVLGNEGVDGFYGPHTRVAVCAFQQRRDLLVDGEVGDNTWRELVETGYALGDRLLYLREPQFRGDDVLALQVKLNLLGFNAGPERGVHDEDVERAVLDFQRNAGLVADGIVGPTTLAQARGVAQGRVGPRGQEDPRPARRLRRGADPRRAGRRRRRRATAAPTAASSRRDGVAEKDVTLTAGPAAGGAAARRGLPGRADADRRQGRAAVRADRDGHGRRRRLHGLAARERPRVAGGDGRGVLLLPAQSLLLGTRAPARGARRRPPRRARDALPRQLRAQLRDPARAARHRPARRAGVPEQPGGRGWAARADFDDRVAAAIGAGLASYLQRAPLDGDDAA